MPTESLKHSIFVFLISVLAEQLRMEDHFRVRTFSTQFCNLLKYGINLKFETFVQFFRKIIELNAVIILKSTNKYDLKNILKSGLKMDLYPAMSSSE